MVKKKLLLIYPKSNYAEYTDIRGTTIFGKRGTYLSNALGTIAALTPPGFEISIIDEHVEKIDFEKPYDLVGITGLLWHITRAKEIAAEFRKRGVKVVCGGPSVTLNTDEWRPFADYLIIGEAEKIWPEFCNDYINSSAKKEYKELKKPELSLTPVPDYSGFSKKIIKTMAIGMVQCSRGCVNRCEFCTCYVYSGNVMRYKPVDSILKEVEQIHNLGIRTIFLTDDNFSADKEKSKEILAALRDWNSGQKEPVFFYTQLSIDAADDDKFLELAAEAGLGSVYIGIESPDRACLKEANKIQNLKTDMVENIKKFHRYGIMVVGALVVGFDHDDLSVFQKQFDFLMDVGIPKIHINILQARGGSSLMKRIVREGRLIHNKLYNKSYVSDKLSFDFLEALNIIPKQMTIDQLKNGTYWLIWNIYKIKNLQYRFDKFFNEFRKSKNFGRLRFPKINLTRSDYFVLLRVVKYFLFSSPLSETMIFLQMIRSAKRSGLPGGPKYVLVHFFLCKALRDILLRQKPDIDSLGYPS